MSKEMSMLTEITELDAEGLKLLDDYWDIRRRYEAVFGKLGRTEVLAPRPIADRIKELSDKLNDYYGQQRMQQTEKRKPELARA